MTMLIIEAFLLTAIAVGAGVLVGVLVKQWFGRRTVGNERLADVMAAAEAAEAGVAPERADEAPESEAEEPEAAEADSVVEEEPDTIVVPAGLARQAPESPEALTGPAAEVSAGLDRIAAADRVGERPPALPGPRDAVADDLKRIRGIGPQNETRLNALGVYHFGQIAAWTPAEVRWVGAYLAFPGRIEREDWIGQARALIAGDRPDPESDQSASGTTGP
jgi:NADH-quinone oxidoreductase subunit E